MLTSRQPSSGWTRTKLNSEDVGAEAVMLAEFTGLHPHLPAPAPGDAMGDAMGAVDPPAPDPDVPGPLLDDVAASPVAEDGGLEAQEETDRRNALIKSMIKLLCVLWKTLFRGTPAALSL